MKKVIIVIVAVVATIFTANAQVFVGGGLGFDFASGKTKTAGTSTDEPSGISFSFTPKVGYWLGDKFAVGLYAGITHGSVKRTTLTSEQKYKTTEWGTGVFARYRLAGLEKLSLQLEGATGISIANSKETTGNTTVEGNPDFTFSIGVLPVLSYSLTERLDIEARSNFLRFGFESVTTKITGDTNRKETANNFGFGANSIDYDLNGLEYTGYQVLELGVIFKF